MKESGLSYKKEERKPKKVRRKTINGNSSKLTI
jgi:hypothetical protein